MAITRDDGFFNLSPLKLFPKHANILPSQNTYPHGNTHKIMKIKWKLSLLVGITILLAFSSTIWVIHHHTTQTVTTLAYQVAEETAHKNAWLVQGRLERLLEKARMLEIILLELVQQQIHDREFINDLLITTIKKDQDILGAWTLWEPNAFDGKDVDFVNAPGHDATGRVNYYWHWNGDQVVVEPNVDWETSDYYQIPQKIRQEILLEPYLYKVSGKEMLLTSAIVPLLYKGKFVGVVGIDYLPDKLQAEISQVNVLGGGYAALMGNSGVIVAHHETKYVGQNIAELKFNSNLTDAIRQGQSYFTIATSPILNTTTYQTFIPIHIGKATPPWSFMVAIPITTALQSVYRLTEYILLIGVVAMIAVLLLLLFFMNRLLTPIATMSTTMSTVLTQMVAKGLDLTRVYSVAVRSSDEVGKLAVAFNEVFAKLHQEFTQRERTEQMLRDREMSLSRLKALVETTSDFIGYGDLQGNILYMNMAGLQMIGRTKEEMTHLKISDCHSPAMTQKVIEEYLPFIMETDIWSGENEVLHRNGTALPVSQVIIALREEDGKMVAIGTIMRDMTGRKRVEEALRHQQELLRSVIDNLPMLVFWKDLNSVYLGCNQQVIQLNGLSSTEEIIGKTDFDLSWKPWADVYRADDRLVMGNDKPKLGIVERVQNQEGVTTWIETNKIPLHDASGQVFGILGTAQDITTHKQAEDLLKEYHQRLEQEVADRTEALRKREEQWSHFFKLPMIGMAQLSPTQKWLQVNDKFCDMLGYSRTELMNVTWVELTYPDDLSAEVTFFNKILAGQLSNYSLEKRFVRKDGQLVYTSLFVNCVRETAGEIDSMVIVLWDITERQQAETALRRSEERFELAMRGATDGLWDWNLQTQEVYYSPRWCDMLGYTPEEIMEQKLDVGVNFLHPEDRKHVFAQVNDYLTGKSSVYSIEFRMRHKQGHYVWLLSRGVGVKNEAGQMVRIVGTHVDMTEHKQAEEALRRSDARFRSLIAATSQIVWTTAADGSVVTEQPGWSAFTGQSFEEVQHGWLNAIHPNDQAQTAVAWLSATKERKLYEIEHRVRRYDGLYRYMRGRGVPLLDETGKLHEWVGVHEDITDRKEAEIVLQQAKEAAEVANRAKSTFLANMSHELRTPLNGILGYAQILARDKTLTPKQQEGIAIIQRSGEYLLTLINDILDLSKIEAGKVELYLVDIDFHKFLQDLTELFKIRTQQKGIAFLFEPLSYLPLGVRADEKRLRQILFNLLGNAVKFTDAGGVSFKVGLQEGKIRFQVEDTGPGIAAEDIDKIFLPFHQVGDAKYKAEGTGLGLPITKRLIEMMGGELHVDSQVGRGSTFWMTLELLEVSGLIKQNTTVAPTIIGIEGRSPKLLVIDDKWENRAVMVNLLSPLGFIVTEATNGQEGVMQTKEQQPDLILTDLVMPVMDGFEATRQIRKLPGFEQTPIIAASASVFDCHQQQSQSAGCNDFIAKPFRAEVLLELLRKYLHLTWTYDTDVPVAKTSQGPTVEDLKTSVQQEKIEPSLKQAEKLFDLAMQGDIGGILEALDELDQTVPRLRSFNSKLRRLAKNFEEQQICQILEEVILRHQESKA